jgi:predicted CopG family antitoxin
MVDLKTLNITLDVEDYEKLVKVKGKRTWREFLLTLLKKQEE